MNSHLRRYLSFIAIPALLVSAAVMVAQPVQRAHYLHQSGQAGTPQNHKLVFSGHRAHYLHQSGQAGTPQNHKLVFSGHRITVPVVAVAPGAPEKTFEIHGKVNPTIILPAGAQVRFKLGNADRGMPHGLAVTRKTPPYPNDAKHKIRPPIAGTGYVSHENSKTSMQVAGTGWITLEPGTYYYVCPVPTHAHDGMYGKIVVKQSNG